MGDEFTLIFFIMAQKNVLTTSEPLEIAEYYLLIDKLREDGIYLWELFCLIACTMALRIGDVLRLKWEDILNVEKGYYREGKTGKTRHITIHPTVQQKYLELYELLGSPKKEQQIFLNEQTGKAFTRQTVNNHLRYYKSKYNLSIKRFSSHSFRKTFGRQVWEDNGQSEYGLLLINRAFGHSSVDTTIRYLGLKQDELSLVYDSIVFKQ